MRSLRVLLPSLALLAGLLVVGPGAPSAGADPGDVTLYDNSPDQAISPSDLVPGPGGLLWFTSNNSVGSLDPSDGDITLYDDAENEVTSAGGIAVGPDGNLWFTSVGNNRIGRLDPDDGSITTYADPQNNVVQPWAITAGPDGNLWFIDAGNGRVGRIDPDDGAIATFLTTGGGGIDIAAGPGGMVWYTSSQG